MIAPTTGWGRFDSPELRPARDAERARRVPISESSGAHVLPLRYDDNGEVENGHRD